MAIDLYKVDANALAQLLRLSCEMGAGDFSSGVFRVETDSIGRPVMSGASILKRLGVSDARRFHAAAVRQAYYVGWRHAEESRRDHAARDARPWDD